LILDLHDYSIAVVNHRIVIDGLTDDMGKTFPIVLLEGLNFDFESYEYGDYTIEKVPLKDIN
jgi:hypothetical protein